MNGLQLIKWLNQYSLVRNAWESLKRDSWFFLGFCIVYMVLLHNDLSLNPLLWRVSLLSNAPYNPLHLKIGANGNHILIVVSMLVTTLALYKKIRIYPVCIAAIGYVMVIHELAWWVTDFFFDPEIGAAIGQTLWVICMVYMMFYPRIISLHWKFILWTGAFYAIWGYFFNFAVTYNFHTGVTLGYFDLLTNGLEVASWVWCLFGFWLFERENLKRRIAEIQAYVNT